MNADHPTIEERVAASRAAQGLPPTVADPGTLARVAAILIHTGRPACDGAPPVVSAPVPLRPGHSHRGGAKAGEA
jgi:hypothetical protein